MDEPWRMSPEQEAELARLARLLLNCNMEHYIPTVSFRGQGGWWAFGCTGYRQSPYFSEPYVLSVVWGDC